eukprot:scaffold1670_cov370-Prasinococcus_capsulatus_cf.AAC.4
MHPRCVTGRCPPWRPGCGTYCARSRGKQRAADQHRHERKRWPVRARGGNQANETRPRRKG